MGRVFLGILLGGVLVAGSLLCWLWRGQVPVAVFDKPLPGEKFLTSIPLHSRIDRELVKAPPIQPDEDNLIAGAHVYSEKCSVCHGFHGQPSPYGARMYPPAPPLWEKHGTSTVIGVSDDPPAESYWKVVNGIRLTGMPAYKALLTDTEIWQVSLLVANADKPLPPAAVEILRGESTAPPAVVVSPASGKK
jgi:mono/diheme cytochrome c family protein